MTTQTQPTKDKYHADYHYHPDLHIQVAW